MLLSLTQTSHVFVVLVGKRDLLSNSEVAGSCLNERCPASTPTSVPGRFWGKIKLNMSYPWWKSRSG